MSTIKITVNQLGRGQVLVDGVDISPAVVSANVDVQAGQRPRLIVELAGYVADVEAEDADLVIPERTREALERLGWTPPAQTGPDAVAGNNP